MSALLVSATTKKELGSKMNEAAATGPSAWAMKMLQKQGWKEGSGLGKEGQGMSSHIRIAKKDDSLGVGAKAAQQDNFMDQWWFAAYAAGAKPIGGAAAETRDTLRRKVARSSASDSDSSDSGSDSSRDLGSAGAGKRKCPHAGTALEGAGPSKRKRSDSSDSSDSSDDDSDAVRSRARAPASSGSGMVIAGGVVIPSFEDLFRATGGARLGMRARRSQPGKWARAEAAAAAAKKATNETGGGLTSASAAAGAAVAEASLGDGEAAGGEKAGKRVKEEKRSKDSKASKKGKEAPSLTGAGADDDAAQASAEKRAKKEKRQARKAASE